MDWEKKVPADIGLIKAPGFERDELVNAFMKIAKVTVERPKSIIVEVNTYRKYIPIVLDAYIRMCEGVRKATMLHDRATDIDYDRSHKRWTPEEDNALIDEVCCDDMNIHKLSTMFGRSPGAIKTHISELVGRKRISQEIAGRFIGIVDGEQIDAEINGTVYKKAE